MNKITEPDTSKSGGVALAQPTVSILLPTHTERSFIRDCLDAILAQDYERIVEVLVIDGGSADGTRDVIEQAGGVVRLVDNPRVTAAAAMNIGIAEAAGEVIVRMDAHALYAADYVRRCIEVLIETGADNVGGRMSPLGTTSFGRAVAAATSTPLGVGAGAFHYASKRQDVDTVFLGCYWTETLRSLGGYDEEQLQWAAEDHELNFRLTKAGGRIVLDPLISSVYFPRDSAKGLAKQYRNYGLGKMSTLWKHRQLPTLRPLAPAGLVAATVIGATFGHGVGRVAIPAAHAGFCAYAARDVASKHSVAPHKAFAVFEIMHWSYGIGIAAGLARILTGRPFTNRPKGHR